MVTEEQFKTLKAWKRTYSDQNFVYSENCINCSNPRIAALAFCEKCHKAFNEIPLKEKASYLLLIEEKDSLESLTKKNYDT